MKGKYFFSLLLIMLVVIVGCKDPTEPGDDNKPPIVPIPPTEAKGPGGPAYLAGDIKDYVHRPRVVTYTHVYVMNQQDYNDTLAHIFVTSGNASFKITDLPEDRVDLIFVNEKYLCGKIGKLLLKPNGNSFCNPLSGGYFIDSTMFITNIADSIGTPDAPAVGLQGYGPGLVVHFKSETPDSVAWVIVQASNCDTLHVYRYDDPVFDPYENDVYYLKCADIETVSDKMLFFNWMKEVKDADPVFAVIQN